jgi:hypothetical protein
MSSAATRPPHLHLVQDRWRRLDRWYRRFRHYLKPTSYPGREQSDHPDLLAVEDYALAFLSECLSIRDWFTKAPGVFKQEEVETLYKNHDLKLCRDIANRLKHMNIDKPGVDAEIEVDRAIVGGSDVVVLPDGSKVRYPRWSASVAPDASGLVVFADGEEYDLVALCQRCYEAIKAFLEANGWSLPLMRLVPELGDYVM